MRQNLYIGTLTNFVVMSAIKCNLRRLYTRLGAGPSPGLIHVLYAPNPTHFMNFFRAKLVTCQIVGPDDLEGQVSRSLSWSMSSVLDNEVS